jgi:Ni,Fe-hydrogenase III large subunit/NADH:ubiquinone oxidoreductase subunit C
MANTIPTAVTARSVRDVLARRLGRFPAVSGPADELSVTVAGDELHAVIEELRALGARHVMMLGLEVRQVRSRAGRVVEEVVAIPNGPVVRVRVDVPDSRAAYPSLTPLVPAAQWDEREIHDVFDIVPTGHPDLRPLLVHEASGGGTAMPYRHFVAHGDGVYQLPVGPIHAGIIEPGHFRFSAVGESILHLDARLFYTHRGLERLVEGRTFDAALAVVEHACGVCTVTHATAFSRAIERLTGTAVSPRARMARVLLAELERFYNHVGDLGNICAGVGFHYGTSRLGWHKEESLRINEALTGHRYLTGMVAPGGLRLELDERGLADLDATIKDLDHKVRSVVRRLVRSDSFMARLHGTGILNTEDARRLGAVGVAARASGLTDDLRRDRPADGYAELDVPLSGAAGGDVAARFHVRAQEASSSAGLIREILRRLPAGPVRVPLAGEARPGSSTVVGAEGPRGASWLWLMAGKGGTVERVHLRSASFANWPVVAAVVPGNLVPDFPLINKSFELCYACTDR